MRTTKWWVFGLCLSLAGQCFFTLPAAKATASAGANSAVTRWPSAENLLSVGEVLEAPADASAYVSLAGVGHLLLASGARVRVAAMAERNDTRASELHATLAAEVLRGDVLFKLEPQADALVQVGGDTFLAARGARFHAALREGRGVFDVSDKVMAELGSWALRVPSAAPELGHWAITMPAAMANAANREAALTIAEPKRLQLNLAASTRPIGAVESMGVILINERATQRSGQLWGNELLQAPKDMSAVATIEQLGQVTLAGGARARLLPGSVRGAESQRVLNATVLNGTATFKLQSDVSACVQAAGSTFVAARGARFRVLIVEGRALIDSASDSVLEMGEWQLNGLSMLPDITRQIGQGGAQGATRRYLVRPVGLSSNLVVKARATRQIEVRVTDEDDRPVPNAPVIFTLSSTGGKSVGTVSTGALAADSAKAFTDANGIARVTFVAGAEVAVGAITATVEGTTASWVGQISLMKFVSGFWTPQNAIPVFATVAAAAAIGVTKVVTKDDSLPIKAKGGPVIKP
ncbi:MAG: hypothetical protein U0X75_03115 [Acidobacteriota bacterium]